MDLFINSIFLICRPYGTLNPGGSYFYKYIVPPGLTIMVI